jgi:hypothetical protein
MFEIFNSPTPPAKLTEYLHENRSSVFQYRQRAILVKHDGGTWHLVCCVVQVFSHDIGVPVRQASRRYERVILFEVWHDAESCRRFIDDVQSNSLQFDEITIARKSNASWHSELASWNNLYMKEAGLIARTRFGVEQLSLNVGMLVAGKLPFYSSIEDAARDWLPFAEYHGQSDSRNQEVLFLFPEFRAHFADAVWSDGILKIKVEGSYARAGRPLLVKGNYRIRKSIEQFSCEISRGHAVLKATPEARCFDYILTDPEGTIFDFTRAQFDTQPQNIGSSFDLAGDAEYELEDDALTFTGDVPAADRVVQLDHNSRQHQEVLRRLDQLIDKIKAINDYEDAEDKEERLAELSAGKTLLQASRARVHAVWLVLVPALVWLIEKFAGGIVSEIAKATLQLVKGLFGL